LLNTPPVFAVYVSMLTLRWIKENGGLPEMELRAKDRANLFYNALDNLPIFTPLVVKEDRSLMNATFTIKDETLEKKFLEECKQNGMVGIKGHRSVGGLRVSMYNAMPITSVKALIALMTDFAKRNG
jgi:phosphoserine aminotransferase